MCGEPMCGVKNMSCTPAFVSTIFRSSIQMFMFDASASFSVSHLAFVCCVMWLLLCDWCVVGGVLMFMFANCCVIGVCCCVIGVCCCGVFADAMVFSLCCVSCCWCCCTCCSLCDMFAVGGGGG